MNVRNSSQCFNITRFSFFHVTVIWQGDITLKKISPIDTSASLSLILFVSSLWESFSIILCHRGLIMGWPRYNRNANNNDIDDDPANMSWNTLFSLQRRYSDRQWGWKYRLELETQSVQEQRPWGTPSNRPTPPWGRCTYLWSPFVLHCVPCVRPLTRSIPPRVAIDPKLLHLTHEPTVKTFN